MELCYKPLGIAERLCYNLPMTKPPTSIRSIRLQTELWAWLAEEAGRRGATVNALVGDLLIEARLKAEEAKADPVKPKPKSAVIKAAERAYFQPNRIVEKFAGLTAAGEPLPERKPRQKGPKK